MKVESLIRTDKEVWSKLYHCYANFYKMPINSNILDEVWDWIFNPDIKFYVIGAKSEQGELNCPRASRIRTNKQVIQEPNKYAS